jgi:hypothetical protein
MYKHLNEIKMNKELNELKDNTNKQLNELKEYTNS